MTTGSKQEINVYFSILIHRILGFQGAENTSFWKLFLSFAIMSSMVAFPCVDEKG